MTDFKSLDLEQLEAVAQAADQTEWVVDFNQNDAVFNIDDQNGHSIAMTSQLPGDDIRLSRRRANTRHIAQFSPVIVLALLEEIKRLKASA